MNGTTKWVAGIMISVASLCVAFGVAYGQIWQNKADVAKVQKVQQKVLEAVTRTETKVDMLLRKENP